MILELFVGLVFLRFMSRLSWLSWGGLEYIEILVGVL